MFNAASKLSFTVAGVAFVAGFGAVFTTSDRVAFSALVFAAVLAAVVGLAAFYFAPRDPVVPASAEVEAATVRVVDTSDIPRTSPWPLVAAVAVTLLGVGAALGKSLIVLGVIASVIAAFAWLAQAWREHPSWTQAMTDRLNDRFVTPIGLPVMVFIFAAIGAISLSRIFLAVDADVAPFIGAAIAFAILGAFYLLSTRESVGRGVLTTLAVVSSALVIAAGIAGALKGEREFHQAGHSESSAKAVIVKADDMAFNTDDLQLPARSQVVLELENADEVEHSLSIYTEKGGEALFTGETVAAGETIEYEFTSPEPGSYYFQCDIHPDEMNGFVEVSEDASAGQDTGTNATTTSTTEH